jgi:hypothetical protein
MCWICERQAAKAGVMVFGQGAVAQLVERLTGSQEVQGFESPQLHLNSSRSWLAMGYTLGGFVAGEGSFSVTRLLPPFQDGTKRQRFVFQIQVAQRDRHILQVLRDFLGFGSINDVPAVKHHWQPLSYFVINSRRAHHLATIPFALTFLLPSAKRDQFLQWKSALDRYEKDHPSRYGEGPSTCSVLGCEKPVRGRKLCRSHYYQATGY